MRSDVTDQRTLVAKSTALSKIKLLLLVSLFFALGLWLACDGAFVRTTAGDENWLIRSNLKSYAAFNGFEVLVGVSAMAFAVWGLRHSLRDLLQGKPDLIISENGLSSKYTKHYSPVPWVQISCITYSEVIDPYILPPWRWFAKPQPRLTVSFNTDQIMKSRIMDPREIEIDLAGLDLSAEEILRVLRKYKPVPIEA